MPVAAARKIEFFARDLDVDIQLHPIVLTHDQCLEYELPRTPLKETINAPGFEARFGEGATELDALEALHPGELRRILEREIARFHDPEFAGEWRWVRLRAERAISGIEDEILERHAVATNALEQRRADLKALAEERLADLRRQVDERIADLRPVVEELMADLRRRADQLVTDASAHNDAIADDLEEAAPAAAGFDWPEPPAGWDDPLLDTTRGYVEQIDRYKAHQGKRTTKKRRKDAGTKRTAVAGLMRKGGAA